jgi:hypothetical protein
MATDLEARDPYVEHVRARVVEAGPRRAVVEQPADDEIANHVMVRHASSLYTAAYAAARELVLAALGERAGSVDVRLEESEIAYRQVGLGLITSTAEPQGEGWGSLAAGVDAGRKVRLETSVVSAGEDGKTVVTLDARWSVAPAR